MRLCMTVSVYVAFMFVIKQICIIAPWFLWRYRKLGTQKLLRVLAQCTVIYLIVSTRLQKKHTWCCKMTVLCLWNCFCLWHYLLMHLKKLKSMLWFCNKLLVKIQFKMFLCCAACLTPHWFIPWVRSFFMFEWLIVQSIPLKMVRYKNWNRNEWKSCFRSP